MHALLLQASTCSRESEFIDRFSEDVAVDLRRRDLRSLYALWYYHITSEMFLVSTQHDSCGKHVRI